jgi:hypothetical protein
VPKVRPAQRHKCNTKTAQRHKCNKKTAQINKIKTLNKQNINNVVGKAVKVKGKVHSITGHEGPEGE